jgi:peroxiredoxin
LSEGYNFVEQHDFMATDGQGISPTTQGIVKMMIRLLMAVLLSSFSLASSLSAQEGSIAAEATSTKPLEKGEKPADVILKDLEGKGISLAALHQDKPLVIVFFRGGWCPFCTKHTQQLIKVYPDLKEKGYEMIGVSPDSVANTKANIDKNSIPFPVYSDSDLNAASRFGLAFKVDDETFTKYKGFGVDLEKVSGQSHHALPVPAIYVVDKDGVITFAHSDPDYRKRLDSAKLLESLASMNEVPEYVERIAQEEKKNEGEKLTIVWTSGDPEVAHRMVLMYGKAAKTNQWFDEVRLVIWGPSARLVAADKDIQAKLKEMKEAGIILQACVVCADSYGVSERLKELGIEVKPMGKPLSNIIRDKNVHLITF